MAKLILVEDHNIFREGLKSLIENNNLGTVIAEASNGKEFIDILNNYEPDLVIMDIEMPVMNGIEATQKAISKFPGLKILALSMFGDEEYYFKMVHAGVKGFVLKTSGKAEFETAIKEVLEGNNFFSSELLRQIIINKNTNKSLEKYINTDIPKFTDREIEVMGLICRGFSNIEIANELNLSHKTIDSYRTKLLQKTNSKNTVSLVMYAIRNKIIKV